ncbi:LysR family transcriptional regulator [Achromobacter denitrificans]|uniref:LysR family transcriptional regulator n=1 Tax=Achromobacter denitrificans TaxID=32002 RepID=UPI00166D5799|nr:LysR substrate-binding domain-containing protein [Achromobacter denitrificans]GFN29622.1 LysR family transcriptional regulator [Achromobacter denitrificans]
MQNARQLDIPRLIAFIAVCEEGSISAASRRLHIAQPALTVTMAKLESALGTKLLERDIRGVTPTPSGAELLARAYDIVGRAQTAFGDIQASAREPQGEVSIGLPASAAAVLALPLIARLSQDYPRIRLRLVDGFSGYLWSWLLAGELDLALVFDRSSTSGVHSAPIAHEDMHLVGVPERMKAGRTVSVSTLADYPLAMSSRRHGIRSALDDYAVRHGTALNVGIEIDAGPYLIQLLKTGAWFSLLAPCAVARDVREGTLATRRLSPTFTRSICLAQRRAVMGDTAVRRAADSLRQVARGLIDDKTWDARPA